MIFLFLGFAFLLFYRHNKWKPLFVFIIIIILFLFVGLKDKSNSHKFQKINSHNQLIPHQEIQAYRLSHIHVWQFGTDEWKRHIAFRDYLKEYSDVRIRYEKLKKKLSKKDWIDGNEYNQAKDGFIKFEQKKAISWYNDLHK